MKHISLFMKTPNVITQKFSWQVSHTILGERELVNENSIPPAFIFPRIHHKDHFTTVAPGGNMGFSSNSSWMTGEPFVQVLKHIKYIVLTSTENTCSW
jgi:hypothetical protein